MIRRYSYRAGLGLAGLLFMASQPATDAEPNAPAPLPTVYTDFSGAWKLDAEASRSEALDKIMEIQGANSFQRSLANRNVVHQTIRQQSNAVLCVTVRSAFQDRTETQYLDGRLVVATNRMGKAIETHAVWVQDGKGIETKANVETAAKEPATLVATRTLTADRKTMNLTAELIVNTNAPIKAVRVFHREE